MAADQSHQQRAGQSGRVGHGDRVDLAERQPGPRQRLIDHRQNALDVGAGGDFGHDSAVALVQLVLRRDDRRADFEPSVTTAAAVSSQVVSRMRTLVMTGGKAASSMLLENGRLRWPNHAIDEITSASQSSQPDGAAITALGPVADSDSRAPFAVADRRTAAWGRFWLRLPRAARASLRHRAGRSFLPTGSSRACPAKCRDRAGFAATGRSRRAHSQSITVVGHHAPLVGVLGVGEAVDVLAAGAMVAGGGQLQGALAPFQLDHVLHAPFAPGALADDDRSVVILQTGRDDLAGAGAVVIHQHGHRKALERAVFLGVPHALRRVAPLGADDAAVGNEQVAGLDGRVQQTARIEAQIEHEAFEPFFLQVDHRFFQVLGRIAAEGRHADVADVLVVVVHEVPRVVGLATLAKHRFDVDPIASDGHRLAAAVPRC